MLDLPLPRMLKIQQNFTQPEIEDIPKTIRQEIKKLKLEQKIKPNETIALTAGSRGIYKIALILKTLVAIFKELGAKPFIFPAMGSHGGGTAEGQLTVLHNYGITEKYVGCPLKATMEVDIIGETRLKTPVFLDHYANQADHIFIVNRIKPHTKLRGTVESGLMKMCLIGIGKREGARTYHREVAHHSWDKIVYAVTDVVVNKIPILGGLALIENSLEKTAHLYALKPSEFQKQEPTLLKTAYHLMAKIPFKDIDLLIVDEMGKEISGTGMDTNITGRKEGSDMNVQRLFVRDLTDQSHGNAQGIGLADYTLQKLVDKIDFQATYLNAQTAYRTDSCKIPMTLENDYEVLRIAQQMTGTEENPDLFKVIWIKNTLELHEFYISENYLDDIRKNPHLQIVEKGLKFYFDEYGQMKLK